MLERKLFSKNAKIKVQNDHGTIIQTLKFHGTTVKQDALNKIKIANKGRELKMQNYFCGFNVNFQILIPDF